jgi:hypothetical protein
MRWTDLPPDSVPADGRASALSRGEWDELRRRLERLPDGHPSRPDGDPDGTAVEGFADEDLADKNLADEDLAGEGSGRPGPIDPRDGKPVDPQRGARGPASPDAGHAKPGGLGDLGGRGEREPYRPWFTEGESREPWFAIQPD